MLAVISTKKKNSRLSMMCSGIKGKLPVFLNISSCSLESTFDYCQHSVAVLCATLHLQWLHQLLLLETKEHKGNIFHGHRALEIGAGEEQIMKRDGIGSHILARKTNLFDAYFCITRYKFVACNDLSSFHWAYCDANVITSKSFRSFDKFFFYIYILIMVKIANYFWEFSKRFSKMCATFSFSSLSKNSLFISCF